jgi:integrase
MRRTYRINCIRSGRAFPHNGHPILGDELRALRRLQREQEPKSPFVFTSERGTPFTTAGFARMIERAGIEARLGFTTHPHMLRQACGHALANKGHNARAASVLGPPQHSAHGAVHRTLANAVKEFLARVIAMK